MEPVSVSTKEAGQALGIGRSSVYILIQDGSLNAIKIGRRTLGTTESIRRFVQSRSVILVDGHITPPPS
ncbi:MAG: helix-turn-helix domain-containing protein [Alphaproteobacteria bacterium]|nr:helix-turn-helix domain-containing protein [Alphaproteobacteria bacterium]